MLPGPRREERLSVPLVFGKRTQREGNRANVGGLRDVALTAGLTLTGALFALPCHSVEVAPTTAARCAPVVLRLDIASSVVGCPSELEVAEWVNTLTGTAYAVDVAHAEANQGACLGASGGESTPSGKPSGKPARINVLIRVEPSDTASAELRAAQRQLHVANDDWRTIGAVQKPELAAIIMALPSDTTDDLSETAPVRTFIQPATCEELLRVAALSISLLATESLTAPLATLPTSERPSEAAVSPASTTTDTSVSKGTGRGTTGPVVSPSATAKEVNADALGPRPFPIWGMQAQGGLGVAPGVNLGGALSAGLGWREWWLRISGSVSTSVKGANIRLEGLAATAVATTWTLGAQPCLTINEDYALCAGAGYALFNARGIGFDVDHSDQLGFWMASVSGAYYWPLVASLRGSFGLELGVPWSRISMSVRGVAEPVWEMPPVSGALFVGLDWR